MLHSTSLRKTIVYFLLGALCGGTFLFSSPVEAAMNMKPISSPPSIRKHPQSSSCCQMGSGWSNTVQRFVDSTGRTGLLRYSRIQRIKGICKQGMPRDTVTEKSENLKNCQQDQFLLSLISSNEIISADETVPLEKLIQTQKKGLEDMEKKLKLIREKLKSIIKAVLKGTLKKEELDSLTEQWQQQEELLREQWQQQEELLREQWQQQEELLREQWRQQGLLNLFKSYKGQHESVKTLIDAVSEMSNFRKKIAEANSIKELSAVIAMYERLLKEVEKDVDLIMEEKERVTVIFYGKEKERDWCGLTRVVEVLAKVKQRNKKRGERRDPWIEALATKELSLLQQAKREKMHPEKTVDSNKREALAKKEEELKQPLSEKEKMHPEKTKEIPSEQQLLQRLNELVGSNKREVFVEKEEELKQPLSKKEKMHLKEIWEEIDKKLEEISSQQQLLQRLNELVGSNKREDFAREGKEQLTKEQLQALVVLGVMVGFVVQIVQGIVITGQQLMKNLCREEAVNGDNFCTSRNVISVC